MIQNEIQRLEYILKSVPSLILVLDRDQFSEKPAKDKWSKKEILGHLCDSALNNIQRFIRVQYEEKLHIIYNQDQWVALQNYDARSMEEVLALWESLNTSILSIWKNINSNCLHRICDTGKNEPEEVTLKFLIEDYNAHLAYHLEQIVNKSF